MKPLPPLKPKDGESATDKFRMASMGYGQDDLCPDRKEAIRHFTRAIELDPLYVKPMFQRMTLLKAQMEYEEAIKDAQRIKEVDPYYQGIGSIILELETLQKEKFEGMKTEVIGGLKSLGNMFLSNFGMSCDNFKMNENPDGTYGMSYQN